MVVEEPTGAALHLRFGSLGEAVDFIMDAAVKLKEASDLAEEA